ncbi:MAG: sugar-binding domain-containing protein, partial [Cyanobacteria bacterium P01_D01_bin.56]
MIQTIPMMLRTYFRDRHWRYLLQLGLGMLLGILIITGLCLPNFAAPSSLSVIQETDISAPSPPQSLNGIWQFLPDQTANTELAPASPQLPSLDWSQSQPIAVPANWYRQGHDIAGVAWYRHLFRVDETLADQELTLTFEGIDYAADVWLNGHYLGFHEGYFQAFKFPVSDWLQFGQANELIVRVNSPLENAPQDWSLHKRLIKGVLSHHDARPGGAWSDRGQEKNTGGIWAPVTLRASRMLVVDHVKVTPQIERNAKQAIAKV